MRPNARRRPVKDRAQPSGHACWPESKLPPATDLGIAPALPEHPSPTDSSPRPVDHPSVALAPRGSRQCRRGHRLPAGCICGTPNCAPESVAGRPSAVLPAGVPDFAFGRAHSCAPEPLNTTPPNAALRARNYAGLLHCPPHGDSPSGPITGPSAQREATGATGHPQCNASRFFQSRHVGPAHHAPIRHANDLIQFLALLHLLQHRNQRMPFIAGARKHLITQRQAVAGNRQRQHHL